jgi:hypothetical protein
MAQQYDLNLRVDVVPGVLPADGGTYWVYVSLRNPDGSIASSPVDVSVQLFSSDQRILSVQPTVPLSRGAEFVNTSLTTTHTAGHAVITALASGFTAGSLAVSTIVPVGYPVSLALFANPLSLMPASGDSGLIIVELLDSLGNPARAPSPVTVSLSSDNPSVATVDSSITINQGSPLAYGQYYAGSLPGSSVLTASASGYGTSVVTVQASGPVPTKLVMYVLPKMIPADGVSYVQVAVALEDDFGFPAVARSDTQVVLTSSNDSVATFQSNLVTIPKGAMYVMTKLFSGAALGLPDTAQLTAQSAGLLKVYTAVTAMPPDYCSGTPARLVMYVLPGIIPADGVSYVQVAVALEDDFGAPAIARSNTQVVLTSSNLTVATFQSNFVTIPKGAMYVMTTLYSGAALNVRNTAQLTAQSPGIFKAVYQTVTAMPPDKSSLTGTIALTNGPDVLLADGFTYPGISAAQLLNATGFPIEVATGHSVTVYYSSSNTLYGDVTSPSVILSGSDYALADFTSTLIPGSTTITAAADNFTEDQELITSIAPAATCLTGAIALTNGPDVLLPDNSTYPGISAAQLLNATGFPIEVPAGHSVTVYYSSSDTLYGTITSPHVIPSGSSYALADFTSTLIPGNTTITAAADNFTEDQKPITSSAPPPTALGLSVEPPFLRATGESYSVVGITLQDSAGNPAKASVDTVVSLFSSNPSVGTVPASVVIPRGATHVIVSFTSTSTPGSTNITASASGFQSTNLTVQTIVPFASLLAAYVAPQPLVADGSTQQFVVQLLDSAGNPAKPELDVPLLVTSDNPSVASVGASATLAGGSSAVSIPLNLGHVAGTSLITVAAQGYTTAAVAVTTVLLPMELSLQVVNSTLVGSSYGMGVEVTSYGRPLEGATVSARANGTVTFTNSLTNDLGVANFTYSPKVPGSDNITVTAQDNGYATSSVTASIRVDAIITLTITALDESGVPIQGVTVSVIDGAKNASSSTTGASGTATLSGLFWGSISISVPSLYQPSGTTRYPFAAWSDGVTAANRTVFLSSSGALTAKYTTQFFVNVISPYGTTTGSGFYAKGSSVSISVSPTSVSSGFLTSRQFSGWQGSVTSTKASASFVLNGPAVVTAQWKNNLTMLYVFIIIIAAVVAAAVGLFWFLRRRRPSVTEPEKEEEFKE